MSLRIACLFCLTVFSQVSVLANSDQMTLFTNFKLIDGTGGQTATKEQCVLTFKGKISQVAHCSEIPMVPEAEIVDLNGKYLLPGFIDTHVHAAWGPLTTDLTGQIPVMTLTYDADISAQILSVLPQYGITTIRNPAAPTEQGVELRDSVAARALFGPEIVTAGAVIDQIVSPGLVETARTPEEIRAVIDAQVAAGVDFVKLYAALPPKLVHAAVKHAKKLQIQTVGHLFLTDWRQAAEYGIDGIVHAMPSSSTLLPEDVRHKYMTSITGSQFLYQWFEYVDLQGEEIKQAISSMAHNSVHHDPTLVAVEGLFFGNQTAVNDHPKLDLLPDRVRADWDMPGGLLHSWSDSDFDRAQLVWPQVLELVALMHKAGVLLTAGSDTVNPNVIPGHSFHRELELLVEAGIPTNDVIRIATLNGAIAMQRTDLGAIEAGRQADFVILDKNPLVDIRNTRSILAVYQDGQLIVNQGEILWKP